MIHMPDNMEKMLQPPFFVFGKQKYYVPLQIQLYIKKP